MELFFDTYLAKPGDNLYKIGASRGYKNPGPLVAFPANHALFRSPQTPNLIRAGERLCIPWHPDLLRKLIATSEELIRQTTEYAGRLIEEQLKNKEDLERFLILVDSINMVAQIHVSIGAFVAESAADGGHLGSRQVLVWVADHHAHLIGGDLIPLVVPSPAVPKKDFKFVLRHTLGPWTPSFWASVYTAWKEDDINIYLYGSEAVVYKNSVRIKEQADRDIGRLQTKIGTMKAQLAMRFYQHHI